MRAAYPLTASHVRSQVGWDVSRSRETETYFPEASGGCDLVGPRARKEEEKKPRRSHSAGEAFTFFAHLPSHPHLGKGGPRVVEGRVRVRIHGLDPQEALSFKRPCGCKKAPQLESMFSDLLTL